MNKYKKSVPLCFFSTIDTNDVITSLKALNDVKVAFNEIIKVLLDINFKLDNKYCDW